MLVLYLCVVYRVEAGPMSAGEVFLYVWVLVSGGRSGLLLGSPGLLLNICTYYQ